MPPCKEASFQQKLFAAEKVRVCFGLCSVPLLPCLAEILLQDMFCSCT